MGTPSAQLGWFTLAAAMVGCVSAPPSTLSTASHWIHPLAASEQAGFLDISDRSNLDFVHAEHEIRGPRAHYLTAPTAGVVAADLDGDLTVDLFFPQLNGPNALFWGRADARWQRGELSESMEMFGHMSSAASAADYDGDGRLDLAVMAPGELRLFRNLGERQFEDVTAQVGLRGGSGYGAAVVWADIDADGDLDLFAGRHLEDPTDGQPGAARDALWENTGGTFALRTGALFDGDDGAALHAVWKDFDDDGDLDLLQANDFGAFLGNSALFENLGDWTFVNRIDDSGIGLLEYPMGAAVRDFDGDGLLDLWLSDIDRSTLLRGTGPFTFVDAGAAWAPEVSHSPGDTSWSVIDVDVDGDGWTDVYQGFGPLRPYEADAPLDAPQADRLLMQTRLDGAPHYALADLPSALQSNTARGAAVADIDRNGVLDLVVGNLAEAPTVLLGRENGASRLTVQVRDSTADNVFGIGERVTVTADGRSQQDTLVAGGRGSFSSSEPLLAFGLGDAEQIEELTVRWSDGSEESFGPLCAHCRVTIRR